MEPKHYVIYFGEGQLLLTSSMVQTYQDAVGVDHGMMRLLIVL